MIKWEHKPSGICPVQANGYFLNHYFYFRARWSWVMIEFAKTKEDWEKDDLEVAYLLKTTAEYEAGTISNSLSKRLIYKGCLRFAFYLLNIKIKGLIKNNKFNKK
ncbi:MAG: hypothetical protein EBR55_08830 [Chitinophagia bacterium]|nr:hypothetical protein [Chitinophagia bacterium]